MESENIRKNEQPNKVIIVPFYNHIMYSEDRVGFSFIIISKYFTAYEFIFFRGRTQIKHQ